VSARRHDPDHLVTAGAVAAAGAAVLYGTSYVATALALRSFTPLGAAAMRGLLGVAALAVVLGLWRVAGPSRLPLSRAGWLRLLVLGLLGGPAFIVAMNTAISLSGATITAFVAGLYAVLAALLAIPLLGERPERVTLAALGLALVGTGLLADLRLGGEAALGVGIGLVAAVSFGLFLVCSRRWSAAHGLAGPMVGAATLGLTAVLVGVLLPLLGIGLFVAEGRPDAWRADAWLAIGWLAVGPGALAAVLVVIGMRRLPARRASAFLLLNPPTAALGGWLLLDERLSPVQVVGAVAILAAIAASSGIFRRE
jgi:probable blue pigment (indigoidine) exporter